MKIYEFVNSDIRAHWEKSGFVPNALESAWLVYQSNNPTIEDINKYITVSFKKSN